MKKMYFAGAIGLAALLGLGWSFLKPTSQQAKPPSAASPVAAAPIAPAPPAVDTLLPDWREVLQAHRKVIVLLASEKKLSASEKNAANQVGHSIFHANRQRITAIEQTLPDGQKVLDARRLEQWSAVLDFVESGAGLFDADRLAFKELLIALQLGLSKESGLNTIKMHKRVSEDIEAMAQIERNYDKEMRQIFNRFESRSIELKRERWDDYVANLNKLLNRDQILKDFGVIVPFPEAPSKSKDGTKGEIYGQAFPAKTVLLTFDDGPHSTYTDEVAAILKQYGINAVFFQVGQNIGAIDNDGKPVLARGAKVSARLIEAGHVLANHSYSHAQLSKKTGDGLKAEVLNTDSLLKAIDASRSPLFRFPYGARNQEGLDVIALAQLRSVMWNIDSLDWADPVPTSIADRVVKAVEQEGRGIILFHDIHERTVKALPLILDRLVAQGYQFNGWDGKNFVAAKSPVKPVSAQGDASLAGYENSWALVVGIDEYTKWPALQYAVRDANAISSVLIEKFGFAKQRVITLNNAQATRAAILSAFNEGFTKAGIKKNDRIFVFFAGHGSTRKLSSGRDLGYIVPVDSDPNNIAVDGIAMTEIQNVAEALTAKHVLFVMDACYSGLGLTRGAGSTNYLRDNARRIGRQMLTAGGADQLVADGGPNGHSVFTWTLLQGLGGKADLNGDGIITATELAAYVAPAVASVSRQTPAFGSLPGSEGGDFIFELAPQTEFINAQTTQLSSDVIALNSKLDSTRQGVADPKVMGQEAGAEKTDPTKIPAPEVKAPKVTAPKVVAIKDLSGQDQTIAMPSAIASSPRQLAVRANDRGLQAFREKNYALAESEFTLALKYRTDFALAANNLGFVYFKQNQFDQAARWFENTLKIDPSRAIAYLNLGDAYAALKLSDKARKAYQTYLELNPSLSSDEAVKLRLEKL